MKANATVLQPATLPTYSPITQHYSPLALCYLLGAQSRSIQNVPNSTVGNVAAYSSVNESIVVSFRFPDYYLVYLAILILKNCLLVQLEGFIGQGSHRPDQRNWGCASYLFQFCEVLKNPLQVLVQRLAELVLVLLNAFQM